MICAYLKQILAQTFEQPEREIFEKGQEKFIY